MVRLSMCLPERLDAFKLQKAWYEVSSAWPIMNARIRTSATAPSGLDYYVPTPSGMARLESNPDPLQRQFYHHDEPNKTLEAYNSTLNGLRAAHEQVRVLPAAGDEREDLYAGANAAHDFDEMLTRSIGVYTAQVTTFADSTLLTISMCHVLGDGFCGRDIYQAWTAALRGVRPAPMQDIGVDTFAAYAPGGPLASITPEQAAAGVEPPIPKGYYVYNWRDKMRFLKNFMWDYYVTAPESELEQRTVCLPHPLVAKLQKEAAEDIAKLGQKVKVGKSDVLYAWLLKHALAGQPDSKTVNPLTIVNLRGRREELQHQLPLGETHPSGAGPREKTWTWPQHEFLNAALPTPLGDIPVSRIYSMPLGELALHIRSGVTTGADLENSRKLLTFSIFHGLWRNRTTNKMALFCRPDAAWIALTDWRALQFGKFDWSPARLGAGSADADAKAPVQAFAMQCHMLTPFTKRCRFALMGEVETGVYMTGWMAKRQWEDVQRGFGRYVHVGKKEAGGRREARL